MNYPPPTFVVQAGAASHVGRRRTQNEDAYLAERPLFVVADGMGGHDRGAFAAWTAIDALRPLAGTELPAPRTVYDAVRAAAQAVRTAAGTGRNAPGSTLAGVAAVNQDGVACWLVFNIGDSRVYRISDGKMEQVSVDHSRVQELVELGALSPAEARSHQEHNIITRALGAGMAALPDPDQWLLTASEGERLLVCSDGLTAELTDQYIVASLLTMTDPQRAADYLVEQAVAAGGRDNVTVVIVDARTVRNSRDVVDDPGEPTEADTAPSAALRVQPPLAEAAAGPPAVGLSGRTNGGDPDAG